MIPSYTGFALRETRSDKYLYVDEGCEVSPLCLECPLPQCKYDDPYWYQQYRRAQRDHEVIAAQKHDGMNIRNLAMKFQMSERSIFRILKRASPAPN